MIKVKDVNDRMAIKVCLAIADKIVVEPGVISASCGSDVITVAQNHTIPTGKYTCRDYFLKPCDFLPARPIVNPDAEYLGQVPSAPPAQMQIDLAKLTDQVLNVSRLKALSVLYKGQPVTVIRAGGTITLTLHNITLTIVPRVSTTKVSLIGLPVTQHQELKDIAKDHQTSVNKIILSAISKELIAMR